LPLPPVTITLVIELSPVVRADHIPDTPRGT